MDFEKSAVRFRPVIWTLSGSDTSARVGIQSEVKTFEAFGVHACTIITAITAQDTQRIYSQHPVSKTLIEQQLSALSNDVAPRVIKLGMLGSVAAVEAFLDELPRRTADTTVVCDPLLLSENEDPMIENEAVEFLKNQLFPHVDILTPNVPEAETFLAREIIDCEDLEPAAQEFLSFGVKHVVMKGGHLCGKMMQDFYSDSEISFWMINDILPTVSGRGTGCVFATALAAAVAKEIPIPDAVIIAKTFVSKSLRTRVPLAANRFLLSQTSLSGAVYKDIPLVCSKPGHDLHETFSFPKISEFQCSTLKKISTLTQAKAFKKETGQICIFEFKNPRSRDATRDLYRELASTDTSGFELNFILNGDLEFFAHAFTNHAQGFLIRCADLENLPLKEMAEKNVKVGVEIGSWVDLGKAKLIRPSYFVLHAEFVKRTENLLQNGSTQVNIHEFFAALLQRPILIKKQDNEILSPNSYPGVSHSGSHKLRSLDL